MHYWYAFPVKKCLVSKPPAMLVSHRPRRKPASETDCHNCRWQIYICPDLSPSPICFLTNELNKVPAVLLIAVPPFCLTFTRMKNGYATEREENAAWWLWDLLHENQYKIKLQNRLLLNAFSPIYTFYHIQIRSACTRVLLMRLI